jgi:hypothetical protein
VLAPGDSEVVRWGYRLARVGLWGMAGSLLVVVVMLWTLDPKPSFEGAIALLGARIMMSLSVVVLCVGGALVQGGRWWTKRQKLPPPR